MYERSLNALIRRRCIELGLHHFGMTTHKIPGYHTSAPGPKGFPDWVICGPGGLIFREAKSDDGRRSLAQIAWGKALTAAGQDYAIWRPADWENGRIDTELRAIHRPREERPAAAAG